MSNVRFIAQPRRNSGFGDSYPAPSQRVIDLTTLNGGLNIWELDYKLEANQSPDTVNMYWQDGSLSSRQGQEYVYHSTTPDPYGLFWDCYKKPWHDFIIAHKGTHLYKIDPETGSHTSILSGLSEQSGAGFFVFRDKLYYINGKEYVYVDASFNAAPVEPFIPTTVMNRTPAGTGGNSYQPENRIAAGKKVQFTADGTSKDYKLPYSDLDSTPAMTAVVNGTTMTEGSGFSVNRTTGVVTFDTAPAQATLQNVNNVTITCYKSDAATKNSVMLCQAVEVFGGDISLAVVLGGTPAQPNAYFWSGSSSSAGIDPTYFPFDYYNLAGNADEYITGFGKQQNMLVIFKERGIGKSNFYTVTIEERDYLRLPYTPINDNIGCDLKGSIRLIQNNLVFANTYGGVYVLLDTTSAGENNIKRISRNVNGDEKRGLLKDLRAVSAKAVTSFDDGQRYWITANEHAYLWDYTISSFGAKESNLSWFFFTGILSRGWFKNITDNFYFTADGSLARFVDEFVDFGEAFERKYTFATQNFGTYEVLKDVQKVIFAVRSDTDSLMTVTYKTDYETRDDATLVNGYAWKLSPRNLTHRGLRVIPFAGVAVRKPRCFHVRHFSMTLTNNEPYTDMSIISAQIFYRYSRGDR